MLNKLKRIDFKKGEFEANGKTYYIEKSLSIERQMYYSKLEPKLTFGTNFETLHNTLGTCINLINDSKLVQAYHGLHNIHSMIGNKLEDRYDVSLEICALFINTEEENRAELNDKKLKSKIDDWKKEGYDYDDFFICALNFAGGFLEKLQQHFQNGLIKKK